VIKLVDLFEKIRELKDITPKTHIRIRVQGDINDRDITYALDIDPDLPVSIVDGDCYINLLPYNDK
jgi:pentose-5-phosphate-3-epimerase